MRGSVWSCSFVKPSKPENQTDKMNQRDQLPATRREWDLGTISFPSAFRP